MVGWTIPFLVSGGNSEEELQSELDATGDVALATGIPKPARSPNLSNRAEEGSIEDIASVGLKANVLSFAEVGIFLDRNVLVVVGKAANVGVVA